MLKPGTDTYRQGLTLGLTMAEIFILILFLLLLLLLTLYAGNRENEKILKAIELILPATESSATTGETTLVAENNNPRLARHKFPDEITKLVRNNKRLKEENAKSTELLDEKVAQEQQGARLREKLLISKGIDPPCWYKKVPGRSEKEREKPYYLMDIAVHAEHLLVRLRQAPPGRGFELLGGQAITTYAEEYAQLPLAPFRRTNKFSLKEFMQWSTPIKSRGKNKQVRDYACVFYVAVWDKTPETAKERWKDAETSIKHSFYTYEMKDEPWKRTDAGS